jgi:hypothetical protein
MYEESAWLLSRLSRLSTNVTLTGADLCTPPYQRKAGSGQAPTNCAELSNAVAVELQAPTFVRRALKNALGSHRSCEGLLLPLTMIPVLSLARAGCCLLTVERSQDAPRHCAGFGASTAAPS